MLDVVNNRRGEGILKRYCTSLGWQRSQWKLAKPLISLGKRLMSGHDAPQKKIFVRSLYLLILSLSLSNILYNMSVLLQFYY